jgi:hypothetical protein
VREHQKPKRDHPEAEHGQEAEDAEEDEQNAYRDPQRLGVRQMDRAAQYVNFAPRQVAVVTSFFGHTRHADYSSDGLLPRAGDLHERPRRAYDAFSLKLRASIVGKQAKKFLSPLCKRQRCAIGTPRSREPCSLIAQLVERSTVNRMVAGSSPAQGAISLPVEDAAPPARTRNPNSSQRPKAPAWSPIPASAPCRRCRCRWSGRCSTPYRDLHRAAVRSTAPALRTDRRPCRRRSWRAG